MIFNKNKWTEVVDAEELLEEEMKEAVADIEPWVKTDLPRRRLSSNHSHLRKLLKALAMKLEIFSLCFSGV